jgi:hypothetical protein
MEIHKCHNLGPSELTNPGPVMEATFAVMQPLSTVGLRMKKQYDMGRSKRVVSPTCALWMSRRYTRNGRSS